MRVCTESPNDITFLHIIICKPHIRVHGFAHFNECLHIRYDNYLCRFMEFTLGALANDVF